MSEQKNRRDVLKTSALAGGSLLLGQSGLHKAAAQGGDKTKATNSTMKTIANLRTIHGKFTDREIPDETIEKILQASVRAANASNMQTYSIVVVRDRDKMQKVCTYRGSCMLLYCIDYNRLKASAKHLEHPYVPDSIVHLVTAGINTAFAAQTAVIAAQSLGVDCLTTNGIHRGDMSRVWTLLDLPKTHCFPLIAVVMGYPTEEPDHKMGRLDGPGVVHREKYHQLTDEELDQITRTYDDKAKHLALNEAWGDQGFKHYLDWMFKVWQGRNTDPTAAETQMFQVLKRCGFIDLQKT